MMTKVDLRLRPAGADTHRPLGVVAIEHEGGRLAPYQTIAWESGDRLMRAHVTSIHERPGHLPHVYADVVDADETLPALI